MPTSKYRVMISRRVIDHTWIEVMADDEDDARDAAQTEIDSIHFDPAAFTWECDEEDTGIELAERL